MLKSVLKLGAIGLLAAAIAGAPMQLLAQTTNTPAAAKKATVEKKAATGTKRSGGGVHGNLAALDKAAKTITVGKHTYQITSDTKIFKAGKPGTLDDVVQGGFGGQRRGQQIQPEVTLPLGLADPGIQLG